MFLRGSSIEKQLYHEDVHRSLNQSSLVFVFLSSAALSGTFPLMSRSAFTAAEARGANACTVSQVPGSSEPHGDVVDVCATRVEAKKQVGAALACIWRH